MSGVMETGRAETGSRNNTERTASLLVSMETKGGAMKDSRKNGQSVKPSAGVVPHTADGLFLCPELLWMLGIIGRVIIAVLCN